MAVAIFAEFRHGKHPSNLLASVTMFVAAGASYYLIAWWPLAVGFGLLFVYKWAGLEPR
jgi:hypothetical protein